MGCAHTRTIAMRRDCTGIIGVDFSWTDIWDALAEIHDESDVVSAGPPPPAPELPSIKEGPPPRPIKRTTQPVPPAWKDMEH